MSTPNVADHIKAARGSVNPGLKQFHDANGVKGGQSWHTFYKTALGHDGHLADLMYE
jgi:hypothetical protein